MTTPRSRSRPLRWLAQHRVAIGWGLLGLAALAVLLALTQQWWHELFDALRRLPAAVFLGAAAILPIFGFSITLIHLVIGARFGGPTGMLVIAVITAIHLTASHLIARGRLRAAVERKLRRRGVRILELGAESPAALALIVALVPGPPYFIRNYLLALSGAPLRVYFAICWPIYVARSAVALYLGDWVQDPSGQQLAVLGAIFVVKISICLLAVHHLRRRHRHLAAALRPGSATSTDERTSTVKRSRPAARRRATHAGRLGKEQGEH